MEAVAVVQVEAEAAVVVVTAVVNRKRETHKTATKHHCITFVNWQLSCVLGVGTPAGAIR